MRFVLSMVACTACARVTEPPLGEPLVTATGDDTVGLTVLGPDYQVVFAGGGIERVHMPQQLLLENVDILGTSSMCNLESLVGIGLFPALVVSANTSAVVIDSFISTLRSGPLVAQIEVGYTLGYDCPTSQQLTGRTIFTFLPSGRIHRADEVTPSTEEISVPATGNTQPCGCDEQADDENFLFTSYWAFDATTPHRNIDVDGNVTPQDGADANVAGACTIYGDRAVAAQFDSATSRIEPNDTAAHVLDIVRGPSVMAEQRTLFSTVKVFGADGIADDECADLLGQLVDPPLVIDGIPTVSNTDGIYVVGGDDVHDETFTIRNDSNTTLTGNFVVSIDLGDPGHLVVSGSSVVSEIAVRSFVEEDGRHTLVFTDPLPPGAEVLVEPF